MESGGRCDLCLSASQKGCSGDCDTEPRRARITTLRAEAQGSSRAWLCFAGGCLHGPAAWTAWTRSDGASPLRRAGQQQRALLHCGAGSEVWISGVVIWPAMLPLKLASRLVTCSHMREEGVARSDSAAEILPLRLVVRAQPGLSVSWCRCLGDSVPHAQRY